VRRNQFVCAVTFSRVSRECLADESRYVEYENRTETHELIFVCAVTNSVKQDSFLFGVCEDGVPDNEKRVKKTSRAQLCVNRDQFVFVENQNMTVSLVSRTFLCVSRDQFVCAMTRSCVYGR